ncbi:hypothetical protein GIB67_025685, partial [Kingdonia uniflora]
MALKIARKGVSSTKCMEFTKGYLARAQEEVDDFLKANPEEVTDLESDENLSTTKVGEVTNQDLAGANITLRDEPRKKRNGKAGRIKGALEKGKGKKRTCPMQNGNLGGCNQESVRATTNISKRSLNSKVTTSSHAHDQHVDENVEPVMSHVQPNVYNEAPSNAPQTLRPGFFGIAAIKILASSRRPVQASKSTTDPWISSNGVIPYFLSISLKYVRPSSTKPVWLQADIRATK